MNKCGYVAVDCMNDLANRDSGVTLRLYNATKDKFKSLSYRFKEQVKTEPDEVFSIIYLKLYNAKLKKSTYFDKIKGCCQGYMYSMAFYWFIDQTKRPDQYTEELDNMGFEEEVDDGMEERYGVLKRCEEEMADDQLRKWRLYKKLKYFDKKTAKEIFPMLGHSNENALFAWVHSRMKVLKDCVAKNNSC